MAQRENFQHDPAYDALHAAIFGKPEERPLAEIYVPPELQTTEFHRSFMRPVWEAEVDVIWSRIVDEMAATGVKGSFLEFGVYVGGSFRRLLNLFSKKNIIDNYWGFDTFSGLPDPSPESDQVVFKKGQFSANRKKTWDYITRGLEKTDHIQLVEGLFCDTLSQVANEIREIAFVRIDCDLYSSTVDALNFLEGRLVNGGVIYFDDWTFDIQTGETKAFFEFAKRTAHLYRFEKLFVMSQSAFSLRVNLL